MYVCTVPRAPVSSEPRIQWSCGIRHGWVLPGACQMPYALDFGLICGGCSCRKLLLLANFSWPSHLITWPHIESRPIVQEDFSPPEVVSFKVNLSPIRFIWVGVLNWGIGQIPLIDVENLPQMWASPSGRSPDTKGRRKMTPIDPRVSLVPLVDFPCLPCQFLHWYQNQHFKLPLWTKDQHLLGWLKHPSLMDQNSVGDSCLLLSGRQPLWA